MKSKNLLSLFFLVFLLPSAIIAQDFSSLEYRNVGPVRGGRVTTVTGTAAEPGTFYMGASGGGVWKTTDYGVTWNNVSDGYFSTPSIGAIAVDQKDPNIVYVGTGSDGLRSNVILGKGMYKSIDGGESWEFVGLKNVGQIGAVEIHPTNHNIVYVAAIGQPFKNNPERGVYKTIDGGKTWNKVFYSRHGKLLCRQSEKPLPGKAKESHGRSFQVVPTLKEASINRSMEVKTGINYPMVCRRD